MTLITIALAVNVLVAGFWGMTLAFTSLSQADAAFGPDTPARRILACLYLAIALASLFGLALPAYAVSIALVLFPIQILYKTLTVGIVRSVRNPVVLSNIAIAALLVAAWISVAS